MERRLLADSDSRPLVALDPTRPASPEALDAAVSAAASLCVHLARSGGCALLLPGDRRATELDSDLGGWTALHARLALIGPGAGAPAARLDARRGSIYWVTANPDRRLPRTLERAYAQPYLVTPGEPGGRAAFRVAGCSGIPVGRGARRAA
jgi:hypothetical protein